MTMASKNPRKETPLDGQVRCPAGHLCSESDQYCRECGSPLPESDDELDVDEPADLAAKWRREAAAAETNDVARARRNCAFELEQLFDRNGGDHDEH